MEISYSNNRILFKFDFDQATANKCKSIGMRWSKRDMAWWCNDNIGSRLAIDYAFPELKIYVPNEHKPRFTFSRNPIAMTHQGAAIDTAKNIKRFGFFDDCGTGKTLTGIELHRLYDVKTLVVCPLGIIESAWIEDIKKFAPELLSTTVDLWSVRNNPKKLDRALRENQICIINFASFKTRINQIKAAGFEMLIIDESSTLKNPTTTITKEMIAFADHLELVYLFSGTPAPNGEQDYWGQMRIIQPGMFDHSSYRFRNKWFYPDRSGFNWQMFPDRKQEFMELISTRSRVVFLDDLADIPPMTFSNIMVEMSPKEKAAYKDMAKKMLIEINGGIITAANAAVKTGKLRQISSGFLYDEEKRTIKIGRSKLTALKEHLEFLGNNQVVIWTAYHTEADMIKEALGESAVVINGENPKNPKDRPDIVARFKRGEIQYLIAHPATMAHGHTLVNCKYMIYYTAPFSPEYMSQSLKRVHRKGQKESCTIYYLLSKNTMDAKILDALNEKQSTSKAALAFIQKMGG